MAQLETATTSNYYSENDTLAGGVIEKITEGAVIFKKDGETFKYEQGED